MHERQATLLLSQSLHSLTHTHTHTHTKRLHCHHPTHIHTAVTRHAHASNSCFHLDVRPFPTSPPTRDTRTHTHTHTRRKNSATLPPSWHPGTHTNTHRVKNLSSLSLSNQPPGSDIHIKKEGQGRRGTCDGWCARPRRKMEGPCAVCHVSTWKERSGQKGRDAPIRSLIAHIPTRHQRSVRLVTEREPLQEAHPPGTRTHTTNCKIDTCIG